MRKLLFLMALIAALVFAVGAVAQTQEFPQTPPRLVGAINGLGEFPLFDSTVDDGSGYNTIRIWCVADTQRFTMWGMVGTTHTKLHPSDISMGAAAFDTMIAVFPGEDRTFVIPPPYQVNLLFFTQGGGGDAYVEAW